MLDKLYKYNEQLGGSENPRDDAQKTSLREDWNTDESTQGLQLSKDVTSKGATANPGQDKKREIEMTKL